MLRRVKSRVRPTLLKMGVRTTRPGSTDPRLPKITSLFIGNVVAQSYREHRRNFMGRVVRTPILEGGGELLNKGHD